MGIVRNKRRIKQRSRTPPEKVWVNDKLITYEEWINSMDEETQNITKSNYEEEKSG